MIKHLEIVGNLLISKFKHEDLQMIIDHNFYHSLENLETDSEFNKSKIVVRDLWWRSLTVNISTY